MGYPSFYPATFDNALKVISQGRSKRDRMIQGNTYLSIVDDDTVALVYHQTAIVTYHRSGEQTLYRAGWATRTTHDRLRAYSAAQSIWGQKTTLIPHESDTYSPDKFIKCRSRKSSGYIAGCKGTGRVHSPDVCYGAAYCGTGKPDCSGGSAYDWGTKLCAHGFEHGKCGWPTYCEHDYSDAHYVECEHGINGRHVTGYTEHECWRCHGTGQENIGHNRESYEWDKHDAILIDATGKVLSVVAAPVAPQYVGNGQPKKPKKAGGWFAPTYKTPQYTPASYAPVTSIKAPIDSGARILADNQRLFPGLRTYMAHPTTGDKATLADIIISLNDTQQWSRVEIADWLDTLDVDLRMRA